MLDIQKLIKYHDYPEEGTLSKIRLNVVKGSVEKSSEKRQGCCGCVRHVCKECEQTVGCWIEDVTVHRSNVSPRLVLCLFTCV